jgi:hypothetical protein
VVRDPEILNQPGKNTARFVAANPKQVLWVISKKSQLPNAYQHLLTHITEDALLILEGSTITSICKPDLLFYIFANHISSARWKESANEIIHRSDFVIRNRRAKMPDHPQLIAPPDSLTLDLAAQPATDLPQIRERIDQVLVSIAKTK